MPYGKRRGKKRKFKRKFKKKSFGKKLLRDARKRGINSAAELAVQIIAKKEIAKSMTPNLIFRRQIWGRYDRELNVFADTGTPVDMLGLIVHIPQIPCWDIQTNAVQVPISDPALEPNVPDYARGTNVLVAGMLQDGFRTSNHVTIKNLGCDLRVFLEPTEDDHPRREDVTLQYAIISVTDRDAFLLQWKPEIEEVLPYKGLGYSSRLDTVTRDAPVDLKFHVITRGKIRMRYNDYSPKERFVHLFKSCNIRYEYQAYVPGVSVMDQVGQRVSGTSKVFLCLRSDSPATTPTAQKIHVQGFMKCGYRNNV